MDDFYGFPFHIFGEKAESKEETQNGGPKRMGSRTVVHTTEKALCLNWAAVF